MHVHVRMLSAGVIRVPNRGSVEANSTKRRFASGPSAKLRIDDVIQIDGLPVVHHRIVELRVTGLSHAAYAIERELDAARFAGPARGSRTPLRMIRRVDRNASHSYPQIHGDCRSHGTP